MFLFETINERMYIPMTYNNPYNRPNYPNPGYQPYPPYSPCPPCPPCPRTPYGGGVRPPYDNDRRPSYGPGPVIIRPR